MTHIQKAAELLRKADEMAEQAEVHGAAIILALATLAQAHIEFATTYGDALGE